MSKHTPTPWKLDSAGVNVTDSSPERYVVANAHGNSVANLEANASFIVTACNEYAALVAVAEAAKLAEREMEVVYKTGVQPTNAQCVTLYGVLCSALSRLSTLRKP